MRLIDWLLWFWGERRGWACLSSIMQRKDDLLDNENDTWARALVAAGAEHRTAMIDEDWRAAEEAIYLIRTATFHLNDGMVALRDRMTDEEVRFD